MGNKINYTIVGGAGHASGNGSVPTKAKPKTKPTGKHPGPPARVTHITSPTPKPNPYDLTVGGTNLSPADVKAAVQSAANTRYGQPILQAKQNISASEQRSNTDIPAWYQNYINALNAGRTMAQQDYGSAAASATVANPTPTGDATVDAAAQIRAGTQNAFANMIRTQGANTLSNLDTNVIPNASLMRAGSLQGEAKNHQNLVQALGELRGEKGDYANTVLSGLRQQYQTFQSNEDAAAAAAAATNSKIDLARDKFNFQKNQNLNKRDSSTGLTYGEEKGMSRPDLLAAAHGWKVANHIKTPKGPEKPYGSGAFAGKTPTWVLQHPQQSQALVDAYRTGKNPSLSPTAIRSNKNAWNAAINYLEQQGGLQGGAQVNDVQTDAHAPYDVANAAYYYATHNHHLTKQMATALRKLGVPVPAGAVLAPGLSGSGQAH